ncbi:hypothetical protein KC992_00130 [Candidatus Saccharibacteria bacterium]|nr:hypothetical protein [Candidatus Saccharibacteria bacterium]
MGEILTLDRSVYIVGMMGAGKSEVGRLVAGYAGVDFIDTDKVIEDMSGETCGALVAAGRFVEAQNAAILSLRPENPTVIATGGSTANYPDLVDHLGVFGVGLFLDVSPWILSGRLSSERIAALNNPDNLSLDGIIDQRRPNYLRASQIVVPVNSIQIPLMTARRAAEAISTYQSEHPLAT